MKHLIGLKTLALSLGLVMVTTACASVNATPQADTMAKESMPKGSMKDHKFVKKGDMSEAAMKAMMAKCKGKMAKEVTVVKDKDGKETKKVMMKCIMKGKDGKMGDMKNNPKMQKMHKMMMGGDGKPMDKEKMQKMHKMMKMHMMHMKTADGKMGDMKNNPKMQKMKKMHMMMAGGDCKKTEEVVKGEDGKEGKKIIIKCEMKEGMKGKMGQKMTQMHEMHMKDGKAKGKMHMKDGKAKGKMHMMMKRPDGKPTEAVKGFHDALEAGDGDKVLSYLDDNVIIYEGGHINPSKENYKNTHLQGDMKASKANKDRTKTIVDQSVTMTPHTATVMTSTETKGKRNGEDYTRLGTETMVLSVKKGKWLITHIHWSGRTVKAKK